MYAYIIWHLLLARTLFQKDIIYYSLTFFSYNKQIIILYYIITIFMMREHTTARSRPRETIIAWRFFLFATPNTFLRSFFMFLTKGNIFIYPYVLNIYNILNGCGYYIEIISLHIVCTILF